MWYAVNGRASADSATAFDPTYEGKVLSTGDAGRTWQTLNPNTHIDALLSDGHALVAVTGRRHRQQRRRRSALDHARGDAPHRCHRAARLVATCT